MVPGMSETVRQGVLLPDPPPPESTVVINDRCLLRSRDGHRLVVACGLALWQYAVVDRMAEAQAMVSLVDQSWADQNDVARAFGCSTKLAVNSRKSKRSTASRR
jgi:hypothetical protein